MMLEQILREQAIKRARVIHPDDATLTSDRRVLPEDTKQALTKVAGHYGLTYKQAVLAATELGIAALQQGVKRR